MTDWHRPELNDITGTHSFPESWKGMGSDTALVNIWQLRDKYDTLVAWQDGFFLRYYRGHSANRRGYGFPLFGTKEKLGTILGFIKYDSRERNIPLEFCLCDEKQRNVIDEFLNVEWYSEDSDSDYIYKRESLATLAGKKLHRKRNHINGFKKIYPEFEYRTIRSGMERDMIGVAEKWLSEKDKLTDGSELLEFESIKNASANMEALGLIGGVLYVDGIAAAMTMGSAVSENCVDVHFEKAYGEYAANGAFTVINQCFSSSEDVLGFEYINREEDMGIEGLKTAKESYYPAYKLKKYYGVCKC